MESSRSLSCRTTWRCHPVSAGWLAFAVFVLLAIQSFAQSNVNSSYVINIPSGFSLIANQLDTGSNNAAQVLPYSDGDSIYMWTGTDWDTYAMDSGSSSGWLDVNFNEIAVANLPILSPGKGFMYFRNASATTITFTGTPHVPVLPVAAPYYFNLLARQTNDVGTYENITGYSPQPGALVLTWNGVGFTTNTYTGAVWTIGAPVLPVGQSGLFYIPAPPCTANLVVNGSFENPAIGANTVANTFSMPGWTSRNSSSTVVASEIWSGTTLGMMAQQGNQHVEINSTTNNVTLSQVVTNLSTNCTTEFCFWFTGRPGDFNNTFSAEVVGSGLPPVTNNPAQYANSNSWQQYCVSFTPLTDTLTIKFTGLSGVDLSGAHIDNVSLIQCCDTNPPCTVLIDCPTNKTVPCGSVWTFDSPVVVSNSCCPTNFFAFTTTTNNSSCPVITRNWTIWDNCGNTNFCTQSVSLTDTNPPTFAGGCSTNVFSAGGNTSWVTPSASSPRPELLARLQSVGVTSTRGFDECAVNEWFAHSFTNLPKCITAAYLEIRLKPCGTICDNDAMHLWFTGSDNNNAVFSQYFGTGNPRAGLATNGWCSYANDPQTFILDLANLPASGAGAANILPLLEANGFLDVTTQDDSGVDYVKLTVVSCCGNSTKTVECGSKWFFDQPVALDDCCTNPTVTVINTLTNGTCPKVITRNWLATDCCGNTNSTSQEVTLIDTTPPVLTVPADIKLSTCSNSAAANFNVKARDACAGLLSATSTPPSGSSFPIGTTTVTSIATDACGNSATKTFNVTVTSQALVETRQLGKADCFIWPREPISGTVVKSAGLLAAHPGVNWKKFDNTAANRPFGASFLGLSNDITCATLEIRLRPNCPGISQNDTLSLGLSTTNTTAWTRYIGSGNPSPGLTNVAWCDQTGCGVTLIIDLGAEGLIPMLNALHQLDIFIQDDTAVDYAKLTYCYCPVNTISLGWPWYMNIGNVDVGRWSTTFSAASNFNSTLTPGATPGVRVGLPVRQIGFHSNATVTATADVLGKSVSPALSLTGEGNGVVSVALASVSPEVSQVQRTLKLNGAVVSTGTLSASNGAPGIIIMHDGVEVSNLGSSGQDGIIMNDGVEFDNLGSSGQDGIIMNDGVEVSNLGSSGQDGIIIMNDIIECLIVRNIGSSGQDGVDFTIRLNNASLMQIPGGGTVLADEVTFKLVDGTLTDDSTITAFNLGSSGQDGVEIAGPAVLAGDLWTQVTGAATASVNGDQLSLTALDPASTNQCGIIIHLPVITDLHLNIEELHHDNSPGSLNGVLNIALIGNVGPDLVPVAKIAFTNEPIHWAMSVDFSAASLAPPLYQVYDHGSNVAAVSFSGTVQVPGLPGTLKASAHKVALGWSDSSVITINGNSYTGNELRVSVSAVDAPPVALRIANLGSSGMDGIAVSGHVPEPVWRMKPLEHDGEVIHVEWTGPAGGVLEAADDLTGPWVIEPNQNANSSEVTQPTRPKRFFRVRHNWD